MPTTRKRQKNSLQSAESETDDGEISDQEEDNDYESEDHTLASQLDPTSNDEEGLDSEDEKLARRKAEKQKRKQAHKERRESMENKLDSLTSSVQVMQELMMRSGYAHQEPKPSTSSKPRDTGKNDSNQKESNLSDQTEALSETTIYKDAVHKQREEDNPEISFNFKNKRDSSSSEERIDTSNELMEIDVNDQFIADCAKQAERQKQQHHQRPEDNPTEDMERSQQVIREAEASKARLFATKGRQNQIISTIPNVGNWVENNLDNEENVVRSADVDEKYLVIGAHVDPLIQQKIINNEFVDFSKLLPKNRFSASDEENRLELVTRGGATYFVPASDRDNASITSFTKWEQAFRVFSNIFSRAYPSKVTELIQYNDIIHVAASTYIWENVYRYDKEFRRHISNFPHHSWSVILQQAWAMYLKDRIPAQRFDRHDNSSHRNPNKVNEICRRFNKGRCPNGNSCKYEHRCDVKECGKFGHRAHICQKRNRNNTNVSNPMQESAK